MYNFPFFLKERKFQKIFVLKKYFELFLRNIFKLFFSHFVENHYIEQEDQLKPPKILGIQQNYK